MDRVRRPSADAGQPLVMGVLNVTPDSFHDGGQFLDPGLAAARAGQMLEEGADWIDVGGESTRPGARQVSTEEEIARVVPVIARLIAEHPQAIVSIDTSKADVAERAIDAGARVINDVSGLSDARMAPLAARRGVVLVVMHMRGVPATMQQNTEYVDLLGEITAFLAERCGRAEAAGLTNDRIVIDPGIGFGKAASDNPSLIASIPELKRLGYRVLIGASRKSFIGQLTGKRDTAERLYGSIGAALAAASLGADIVRVHDVGPTRDALRVFSACRAPARDGGANAR